ncbi:Lrp/AsnC ligand binding domain-containing protein [Candidatus Nitrosopumilus sediminis]|uniref:Transcription regulator AsnC/Lrp ligand binding domain-containing protein n=1 Tax=Candidatus Nitrosopumilus sediminis TaxID=1229909 RepID=K0B7U1_9ARCH|nr:Lrp/AsnC ligand binding domain-containing protein [Candidatus Nitrosopumilus sediminis]AFS82213.1 hypothetical protein NSED_02015 [Candidatus Nitrosopumilus sediminis]
MGVSYLLLTCAIHKNTEVANTIRKLSGVREAVPVHGAYDCIVKVEKSTPDDAIQFILSSIRPLDDIRNIITLHDAPPLIMKQNV